MNYTVNIDPNRRHLYLQIICGKAFLEYLNEEEPIPGVSQPYFTLHIHFRGQRFKSRAFPVACEPKIEEGFLIELHKERQGLNENVIYYYCQLYFTYLYC